MNPWNSILAAKHSQLSRALRVALGTVCEGGEPKITRASLRKQLKRIQINAATAGDNVVIPGGQAGVKQIFEVVMWNVTKQTLIWQQGLTANSPIVQTRFTDFPDATGFTLGFNGNWDMPHWEIDNGQPLVLNLQNGTQVDGFVVYRVQNGTN